MAGAHVFHAVQHSELDTLGLVAIRDFLKITVVASIDSELLENLIHMEGNDANSVDDLFCRPDQFIRNSYVDDNSSWLVSSFPSLLYTMSSHRDIYIYEMLRHDFTEPTRCRHRGGMVNPLGCKACRAIR
jgi:hypothetical protein